MGPLLCELHAHTTWSDGELELPELVNLYGRNGFDVLAVTDHVVRDRSCLHRGNFSAYLDQIEDEAERARREYGLLVIPGVELTENDPRPERAAHALALGLREFVGLEYGLDEALQRAREAEALLIGAHPYALDDARLGQRGTARYSQEREWAAAALHRVELINRFDVFDWVRQLGLPLVATGDFHRREHLWTWKTLVVCERTEKAVLDHLRSTRPVDLLRISVDEGAARAA